MKRVGPQPARPGRHGLEAAGWGGRWACGPAPVSSVGPRRSLPSRYSLLLLEFEFPPLKKTPRGDPGGAEGLAASGSTSVVPWDLTRTLLGSEDTGAHPRTPKACLAVCVGAAPLLLRVQGLELVRLISATLWQTWGQRWNGVGWGGVPTAHPRSFSQHKALEGSTAPLDGASQLSQGFWELRLKTGTADRSGCRLWRH